MHRLPKTFTPSILAGKRLDQLCIGEYQIQLRFSEMLIISIEGTVSTKGSPNLPIFEAAEKLIGFIGMFIESCTIHGTSDIKLIFMDSAWLIIHDSNQSTESYSIELPTGIIIV